MVCIKDEIKTSNEIESRAPLVDERLQTLCANYLTICLHLYDISSFHCG